MASVICVLSIVVGFLIYRQGVKDGMKVKDGKLEKIVPVRRKPKEAEKMQSSYAKGMASILNYRNRDERRKDDK